MELGIDIGTHMARAAYLDQQGQPQLVTLPNGRTVLPAMARQTMHGLVVGEAAARSLAGNGETTVCGCTSLMGQVGTLPETVRSRLPYPVRQVEGETICNLLYAEVYASDIYGQIVKTLLDQAGQSLQQPIEAVVLTIPATAQDRFRVQAKAAVEAQGVRVKRLINQPSASLLAIKNQLNWTKKASNVAIIQCGGGSLDISIAAQSKAGIQILATSGDEQLGGEAITWQVADQLNQRFKQQAPIDVLSTGHSQIAAYGLRTAAEEALMGLSLAPEMTLTIDHGAGFGRDLTTQVSRNHLEVWLRPLLAQLKVLAKRVLAQAQLRPQQLDHIVLTGEWAYLPALQQTIADTFQKPVGVLINEEAALLPVYGAALASSNAVENLWDVTPYPLGINCYYGNQERFSPIITANTTIPTPSIGSKKAFTASYQTRYANQTSVTLDILQYRGRHNPDPYGPTPVKPTECEVLGTWTFDGLSPKKGRSAAFTVTFAVDADGILQLFARETKTGHSLTATVDRGIG